MSRSRPRQPRPSGLTRIEIAILIAIVALLISIVIPLMRRARETGCNIPCASNLRQIGQAILMYASENGGTYPPDFGVLLQTQQLTSDVFICPSSSDMKAEGKTAAAKAANLQTPGHCSYIYVGAGLTTKSDPEAIAAFDDPANHGYAGTHVLYVDGHVDWCDLGQVVDILNDLNTGQNPPKTSSRWPTNAEVTQAYNTTWKPRMAQLKTGPWVLPTTQPATEPSVRK